jgi:hypothetical protein
VQIAAKYNTGTMVWDSGASGAGNSDTGTGLLDRKLHLWRDPTAITVLMQAHKGIPNTLPLSYDVINGAHAGQRTSAYIFHRLSSNIEDVTLEFNVTPGGNSIRSIRDSSDNLIEPTNYIYTPRLTSNHSSSPNKPSEIATLFIQGPAIFAAMLNSNSSDPLSSPGVKTKLTIYFTTGAPVTIPIVIWDKPTLNTIHEEAYAQTGRDFEIPITFKGLENVAAIRALYKEMAPGEKYSSGRNVVDEWTQYLGPLQAGYLVRRDSEV